MKSPGRPGAAAGFVPAALAVFLLALPGCTTRVAAPARPEATGRVEWAYGRGSGAAPVTFGRHPNGDLRMTVASTPRPIVIAQRAGAWPVPAALADWQAVAEAYEGRRHVPAGSTEVRTARFSVRYSASGFDLVVAASGARFRILLAAPR